MYAKGISIVMPCLNEERTLGICIDKALKSIQESGLLGEVIIADNGSLDASIEIAENKGVRTIQVLDKGYGSALRGGIAAANYNYIIMGDSDNSYDFSNITGFIEKLEEGFDLVIGNRFAGGIEPGAMSFSHQYIGNPILSGIGRLFFKTKIRDFHCGLRGFKKDSIEKLNLSTTGMEFASEMIVKAVLFNLKITELPCKLYPDGRDRAPHLRSIPDGLRHLEFLLIYSPKWLFMYPGVILMVLGFFFTIMIYIQPIRFGAIQLETTTMLYSAIGMLIGFQMIQFSVFTDIFGSMIGQFPRNKGISNRISIFMNQKGYLIAFIISIIGSIGILVSFIAWAQTGFGELNTTWVCRTAVMFGSLLAVGIEMFLFTVFLRVLQIGR